jgi:hypothetical protein
MKAKHLLYPILFVFLSACADRSSDLESTLDDSVSNAVQADNVPSSGNLAEARTDGNKTLTVKDRKFIWTANLEYQVTNLDKATEEVQEWCKDHKAFVSNMQLVTDNYRMTNTVEIRVENDQFHALIKRFRGQAKFVQLFNISSQDVTEEYVDIESRLNTKRDVRDRYIEVLRNKAGTVKEILEAEEAIRVITEEIEVIEGRLRYLNDQVSYSTIRLTMYQTVKYKEHPELYEKSYGTELGEGASAGWEIVKAIFLGIVTLWPLWILLFIGIWKGRWIWRTLFRSANAQTPKTNKE